MTEEEAKTKWCPYAPLSPRENADGNRHSDTSCIASECMMWQWLTDAKISELGLTVRYEKSSTEGYCGLAGAPS